MEAIKKTVTGLTIEDWYKHLDKQPDDWEYRSIFADWLFEHNNPELRKAQLFLIENKKYAQECYMSVSGKTVVIFGSRSYKEYNLCILPLDIIKRIQLLKSDIYHNYDKWHIDNKTFAWFYYNNLQESEYWLSQALK